MNIKIKQKDKAFSPIKISITLESEEELEEFIARMLLSHEAVYTVLYDPFDTKYDDFMSKFIPDIPITEKIAAEILQGEYNL